MNIRSALSRLRGAVSVALLLAFLAAGVPAANASVENCLYPDTYGPQIDDVRYGPSVSTPAATQVTALVSDRPFYPVEDAFGNWITGVTVSVDGGPAVAMRGEKRYQIQQDYVVDLDLAQLPVGFHTLTFVAVDECDRSDPTDSDIIVLGPGLVATCAFPFDDIC